MHKNCSTPQLRDVSALQRRIISQTTSSTIGKTLFLNLALIKLQLNSRAHSKNLSHQKSPIQADRQPHRRRTIPSRTRTPPSQNLQFQHRTHPTQPLPKKAKAIRKDEKTQKTKLAIKTGNTNEKFNYTNIKLKHSTTKN
jgi:hypothetical protein